MFLASGHAFADLEVESASPACKELAVKLQECEGMQGRCTLWGQGQDVYSGRMITMEVKLPVCLLYVSACQNVGVSVEKYLLCERKEMQRQLQEIQGQLDEMQEPASGVTSTTDRRKLGLNLGAYGALAAPLYLNRAIKRALRELRESQCQQAEDGDA